jgi:hypothetical protein
VLAITVHVFVFIVLFTSVDRRSALATTHHRPSNDAAVVTEVRS